MTTTRTEHQEHHVTESTVTDLRRELDTPGAKCPACSLQYGHSEVLRLPVAVRAAA